MRTNIKIKRNLLAAAAAVMAITLCGLSLVACSAKEKDKNADTSGETVSEEASSVEPPKPSVYYDRLTGEETSQEGSSLRPVAVMVNNIKPSLPQRGIADASIIYELPVEGGVTRLMAVFSDYKALPTIGSIRSARHDYVELVKPLDALYVHIGWSTSGKAAIEKEQIKDLNGLTMSNHFYIDEARAKTRSSEHCWYTNSDLVTSGAEKLNVDMVQGEASPLFTFAKPATDTMADYTSALPASSARLTVSPSSPAEFNFNAASGKYEKSFLKAPHIDENTNEAIAVKNVFLMYCNVSMMSDNYHREIDLASGKGYYLSNGKSIPVTYKKSAVNSLIEVFDETGKPLLVNAGNSYFGVIPSGEEKNLVIE